ncbi:MAG: ABC transporter permease subunit [Lachnospiraceae bacterium]
MNILKRELKVGMKTFLFWMIGMFMLIFVGMFKFIGFEGETSVMEIFDAFPRIVLAVFGMVGVDFTTLGGYYSLIAYYSMLCAAIYGIHLGAGAITREGMDKTYEFIFTKPRSRTFILQRKLLAGLIYLVLFSVMTYLISLLAIKTIDTGEMLASSVVLFNLANFFVSLMFFMIAACISCYVKKDEAGMRFSNLCFLLFFVTSMIYDMLENGGIIKIIAPFKYFAPWDILEGVLDLKFVILCLAAAIGCYFWSVRSFRQKDLLS